ncbi:MAG: bifunctional riboflavin kinase/FAD synthetase [Chloroflexi bacterium]|nr:bifunctional riboflavin kinase/FAD synthetase [Chloroflexota bacterium]
MTANLARRELARVAPGRPSAVTIGVFDGVHRGHQHLVTQLVTQAQDEGLATLAVTFNPHPRTVLSPGSAVTYLTSLEERVELLQGLGLDAVAVLSFTSQLSQISPEDFLVLLIDELKMKLLVVGPDFALGRNRAGTVEVAKEIGARRGFRVGVASLLEEGNVKVGSSAVREALYAGNVDLVSRLLGRPFSLRGPVVAGDKRGRELGFPTANIGVGLDHALPDYGIYVTRAYVRESTYQACTSIGVRPTFEESARPVVETYILDFDEDIYGQEIRIDLLHRVRGEEKFQSADDLIERMHRDISETREYFRVHG